MEVSDQPGYTDYITKLDIMNIQYSVNYMKVTRKDPSRTPGNMSADLAGYVEEFGLAMEASGLPRAAGRLFGWLLVCDPAEQSAHDLSLALQASTGGVSQNLRFLRQVKFVERVGRAGDRRAYYRIAPGVWETLMVAQLADTTRFRQFGNKGLALLAEQSPSRRERLAEMTDFYAFWEREIPALISRYRDGRGTNHG